jgi:hypothetical protein
MVVDAAGKRLTPELFNTLDAQPYDGMLRTVQRIPDKHEGDWFYGFINIHGQVIVPPKFTYKHKISSFREGLASVCDRERGCGYLAPDGSWALPMHKEWTEAHDFHHGLALVRGPGYMTDSFPMSSVGPQHIKQPWSVIDKSGRIVMGYDPATEKTPLPSEEELTVQRRFGLFTQPDINIQGDFIDGRAMFSQKVSTNRGHNIGNGMVDTTGRIVVPPSTKYYREDELRAAYFPQKNREPSAVLRKKFYVVNDFYEGFALAIKSHWVDRYGSNRFSGSGFVDRQGRWVIAPIQGFSNLEIPFRDGHAVVRIYEPEFGYANVLMDRTGRIVANYRKLLHPSEVTN